MNTLELVPNNLQKTPKEHDFPAWISPMLATLAHQPFSDKNWVFERKLVGEQCLAFKHGRSEN